MPVYLAVVVRASLFFAGLSYWTFNVGVLLSIFDLLALAFVLGSVVGGKLPLSNASGTARIFLWFIAARIALLVYSGPVAMVVGSSANSMQHYFTAASAQLTYHLFAACLVIFLSGSVPDERRRILRWFMAGVAASAALELVEIHLLTTYRFDLEPVLWNAISFRPNRDAGSFQMQRYVWDYLYRGTGFTGPNLQGTYMAAAIPWLLLRFSRRPALGVGLLLALTGAGLALTLSRTGMVAAGVGLIVATSIALWRRQPLLKGWLLVACLSAASWMAFSEDFIHFAGTRPSVDETRLDMYQNALRIFNEHPMGVGVGGYTPVVQGRGKNPIADPNPHSSWLETLVNEGVPGVLWYVAFLSFVFVALARSRSPDAAGLAGSVAGLAIAGFFNTHFDQLWVLAFWAIAIAATFPGSLGALDRRDRRPVPARIQSQSGPPFRAGVRTPIGRRFPV